MGFRGRAITVNKVCGSFGGPGETAGKEQIPCDAPILADYVTVQILETGTLHINELEVNQDRIVASVNDGK